MSLINPKPIIARTHRTWRVPPGMVIALVEDLEHRLWVVESCPAGTKFWTLDQAAHLELGTHTRRAFQAAVQLGRLELKAKISTPPAAPRPTTPVAPVARVHRSENPGAKMPRQTRIRPISVPSRKTLVGV